MKDKQVLKTLLVLAAAAAVLAALAPLELKRAELIFSSNLPEWLKFLIF